MTVETRDILISRQVALKAAVEMAGEKTLAEVLTWATAFEDWILRDLVAPQQTHAQPTGGTSSAPRPQGDGTQTSPPQGAEWEPDPAPAIMGEFDIEKCPIHKQSAVSKFNKDSLYCPSSKECEWQRVDFFDTDENTGEVNRHRKYRLRKADKYQWPNDFMLNLEQEGALTR